MKKPSPKSFTGADVLRLRKKLGLTQLAFGEILGVDEPAVCRLEKRGAEKLMLMDRRRLVLEEMQALGPEGIAKRFPELYPDPITGTDIRRLREKLSLSQMELARLMEVRVTTIDKWEARGDEKLKLIKRARSAFERVQQYDLDMVAELKEEKNLEIDGDLNPITGSELLRIRKKWKLTQRKMGELIGVSPEMVGFWERKGSEPLNVGNEMRTAFEQIEASGPEAVAKPFENSSVGSITGKDVIRLRKKLALSQQEFAQMLDLGKQTIVRWERKGSKKLVLRSKAKIALERALSPDSFERAKRFSKSFLTPVTGSDITAMREYYGMTKLEFARLLEIRRTVLASWEDKADQELKLSEKSRQKLKQIQGVTLKQAWDRLRNIPGVTHEGW